MTTRRRPSRIPTYDHLPYDKRPPTTRLSEEEKTELCRRLMLSEIGMPRLCVLRHCRRKKRCFGPGMICKQHHEALVNARIDALVAKVMREEGGGKELVAGEKE